MCISVNLMGFFITSVVKFLRFCSRKENQRRAKSLLLGDVKYFYRDLDYNHALIIVLARLAIFLLEFLTKRDR